MRGIVIPNKALRSLDVAKLRLSTQLREVLILFEELSGVPIAQQLSFITATYNDAVFQIHVPARLADAVQRHRVEMSLEIGQTFNLVLRQSPEVVLRLYENFKFSPVCEYFCDSAILQNDYQAVFHVKNSDPAQIGQLGRVSDAYCYISAYHQQYFQLSAQYLFNMELLDRAPFWDSGFIDNENKIGRRLKAIETDDSAIGSEVDRFLDVVGLDRLTFCYSQRELETDACKKSPNVDVYFVEVEGGLQGFRSLLLQRQAKDDDI